jgi:hypothetical protein
VIVRLIRWRCGDAPSENTNRRFWPPHRRDLRGGQYWADPTGRREGSAPDALDLFLDAELLAFQFLKMDRVGQRSVDFFIDFVFEPGVFCFQRFDTIFDGHPLPPSLGMPD